MKRTMIETFSLATILVGSIMTYFKIGMFPQ